MTVLCYEAQKNGDSVEDVPGYVAPASRDGPSQTITQDNTVSLVTQIHVSNFWPSDVLMEEMKLSAVGEFEAKDNFGRMCKGVWREAFDDPVDLPRRVRKVYQEEKDTAKRTAVKDRSKDHIRAGQGDDAWRLAASQVSFHTKASDSGNVEMVADAIGDSDEDFASLVVPRAARLQQPSSGSGALAVPSASPSSAKPKGKAKVQSRVAGTATKVMILIIWKCFEAYLCLANLRDPHTQHSSHLYLGHAP